MTCKSGWVFSRKPSSLSVSGEACTSTAGVLVLPVLIIVTCYFFESQTIKFAICIFEQYPIRCTNVLYP